MNTNPVARSLVQLGVVALTLTLIFGSAMWASGDWEPRIPLSLGAAGTLLMIIGLHLRRKSKTGRGFEVKSSMGYSPVPEKKEIDHG